MAGQIIKRGENVHLIRIYLGRGEGGKRSYLNQTVHGTKKDAQRELTKLLRERDLGTLAQPSRTSLDDYRTYARKTIGIEGFLSCCFT